MLRVLGDVRALLLKMPSADRVEGLNSRFSQISSKFYNYFVTCLDKYQYISNSITNIPSIQGETKMTFQNQVILNRPATRFSCLSSLWVIFFILLVVAQSAHGQAVKILPLGDSWTDGIKHHVSYRYDLWFKLIDAGFDVDFVGSKRTTYDDPDLDLYPKYLTEFDRDHQGHAGYRTDELVAIAKSVSARHQPDIVLLWAGGVDLELQGSGGTVNARFALRDIIEGIRSYVPGVTILMGLVHPTILDNTEFMKPLNDAIAAIALELDTTESPVILIDHVTGFDIEA